MKRKVVLAVAALTLVVVATASTYAWARGTAENSIRACVAKADGSVRIVAVADACKNGESALEWNQVGQIGPAGPQGTTGRDGRDGAQGPAGAPGTSSGTPDVIAVSHEIVSPRDAASGLPTGKRQHKPFVITKELDKSTPLLYNALVTNENLTSVVFSYFRGGTAFMTVKLTNASISDVKQVGKYEEIAFTYQKIEWTWVDGGITAMDDWEAPVA